LEYNAPIPAATLRQDMIEIHFYGKLRRFASDRDASGYSIVQAPLEEGDTIQSVLKRLGVPLNEVGSNIFLNWTYSALDRSVQSGDRLAVFPDDMQLLYKWYFPKVGKDVQEDRR
jgi:molybdopterin converting factor small subunit